MNHLSALSRRLSSFEAVYCSGFFIPSPAVVTALGLLFERVHFLNNLEYVVEFARHHAIILPSQLPEPNITIQPTELESDAPDPLADLTPEQKQTVARYVFLADSFLLQYSDLFPSVFASSLYPEGSLFTVELIKKGGPGRLNTYRASRNPMQVTTGAEDEFARLLNEGRVPVVGNTLLPFQAPSRPRPSPVDLAAQLAIHSVAMCLPATAPATDEDILEARHRLRDQLPPFWSAMLKLSVSLSGRLTASTSQADLEREVSDVVGSIVRPSLIDLTSKLEKERRQWFRRVLSPLASSLRLLAGRPPTDLAGLAAASLVVGADVSVDLAQQLRSIESLRSESGLAYLIDLQGAITPRKRRSTRRATAAG